MRKSKLTLLLAIVCIAFLKITILSLNLKGIAGMPFLKIPYSPRASAIAGAYTAVADRADGMEWNPAGVFQLDKNDVMFSHNEWFEGIRFDNISFVHSTEGAGNIGVALRFLYMSQLLKTKVSESGEIFDLPDENGKILPANKDYFGAYNGILTLNYSNRMSYKLYYGLNMKILMQTIDEYTSYGLGLDFGIIKKVDTVRLGHSLEIFYLYPSLRKLIPDVIGISIVNVGKTTAFIETGDILPLTFRLGMKYDYEISETNRLDLSIDVVQPIDFNTQLLLGTEFIINEKIALRGGYKLGNDFGWLSGLTFGLGYKYGDINFDYSFSSYGYDKLGVVNQISFSYKFGFARKIPILKLVVLDENTMQETRDTHTIVMRQQKKETYQPQRVQETKIETQQSTVEPEQTVVAPEPVVEEVEPEIQQPDESMQNKIIQHGPTAEEHVIKADALYNSGKFSEAIAEYNIAIQMNPKNVGKIYQKLGDAYLANGDIDKAQETYMKASE